MGWWRAKVRLSPLNWEILKVEFELRFFADFNRKFPFLAEISVAGDTKEGGEMSMGEISVKIGEKLLQAKNRRNLQKIAGGCNLSEKFRFVSPIFREISPYFLPVQPAHRIKICLFFFQKKKNIRCYLVIWSWFAGKGCVSQPGSKIVDLGFVKFKSNGTKAKRPLEQIQKTEGANKKKSNLFGFPWGFGMDFLGNQRMNFPGNRMGDGFSWESNGGCKKKKMIRLEPARIESGRGK